MPKLTDELTIADGFMFGTVMSDPKHCKPLLEMVLGVEISRIKYLEPQKATDERYGSRAFGSTYNVAGESVRVYDVEIQMESKKSLRIWYYKG